MPGTHVYRRVVLRVVGSAGRWVGFAVPESKKRAAKGLWMNLDDEPVSDVGESFIDCALSDTEQFSGARCSRGASPDVLSCGEIARRGIAAGGMVNTRAEP